LICDAIRTSGWIAEPERRFEREGGTVVLDVLARTPEGGESLAFEVQCTRQTLDTTAERTSKYAELGIQTIWLFRQASIPVAPSSAAVWLDFTDKGVFVVLPSAIYVSDIEMGCNPSIKKPEYEGTRVSLKAFVEAAIEGRLGYGKTTDVRADFTVRVGKATCPGCLSVTDVATAVYATFNGGGVRDREQSYLVDYLPESWAELLEQMRPRQRLPKIVKADQSSRGNRGYATACQHCGHALRSAWTSPPSDKPIRRFQTEVTSAFGLGRSEVGDSWGIRHRPSDTASRR
jgi:hypothetical protein